MAANTGFVADEAVKVAVAGIFLVGTADVPSRFGEGLGTVAEGGAGLWIKAQLNFVEASDPDESAVVTNVTVDFIQSLKIAAVWLAFDRGFIAVCWVAHSATAGISVGSSGTKTLVVRSPAK